MGARHRGPTSQRITRIATGLLSFARQSPEEPGPIHVNTVVEETLLLVGRQFGKDGIQVSVTLDPTLGPLWGNGNALQQVLTKSCQRSRYCSSCRTTRS
jgi:C4-dicarboxylate-specific signal transduction histidine kinase